MYTYIHIPSSGKNKNRICFVDVDNTKLACHVYVDGYIGMWKSKMSIIYGSQFWT